MDIQTIAGGIANGAQAVLQTAGDIVLWSGRTIQYGFTNYIVPAIKALWSASGTILFEAAKFLQSSAGIALSLSAGLFVTGRFIWNMTGADIYEDNAPMRSTLAALAVSVYTGAVLAAGYGISGLIVGI